jgi:hypothetical protein
MESHIEQTWEMLRASSAKAAKRAEQTMIDVRDVFHLSHELSEEGRSFGVSAEDLHNAHDLSQHSSWWNFPQDKQSQLLREYWRKYLVPRDIALSQESQRSFTSIEKELEEPYISTKKKRVLVSSISAKQEPNGWHFWIPAKTYEVWTLLCWHGNFWLDDFVIPQKFYAQPFAQVKKKSKDNPIHLRLWKIGEKWNMQFVDYSVGNNNVESKPIDITHLRSNYEPLK